MENFVLGGNLPNGPGPMQFSMRGDDFSARAERGFSLVNPPILRNATEISPGKYRTEWEGLSDIEDGFEIAFS